MDLLFIYLTGKEKGRKVRVELSSFLKEGFFFFKAAWQPFYCNTLLHCGTFSTHTFLPLPAGGFESAVTTEALLSGLVWQSWNALGWKISLRAESPACDQTAPCHLDHGT